MDRTGARRRVRRRVVADAEGLRVLWFEAALPELAEGLCAIVSDPDLEVIVDRAIGYSLAANGGEVIEVKIPIVYSGFHWGRISDPACSLSSE